MRLLRSFATLLLVLFFGIGGALFSYLVLPWMRPHSQAALGAVRGMWKLLVWAMAFLGLAKADYSNLPVARGRVIVANHPSLLDVVLLTVGFPGSFSVAKRGLTKNPTVRQIVRLVFLHDDETLIEQAKPLLVAGYNVIIFPEGSRSPLNGELRKFRRGAAQLAYRTGAPVLPVRIEMNERRLGKGQPVWEVGSRCLRYRLTALPEITPPPPNPEISPHRAASELTRKIFEALSA